MTDAREIIALALIDLEPITRKAAERYADHILSTIDRKSFRILRPDEVDPVTLDRVAQFTKSDFQRDFESPIGWRDQFAAAIRALGRKA